MYQYDYLSRQIKAVSEMLTILIFGKSNTNKDEIILNGQDDENYKLIKKYLEEINYNQAENTLFLLLEDRSINPKRNYSMVI